MSVKKVTNKCNEITESILESYILDKHRESQEPKRSEVFRNHLLKETKANDMSEIAVMLAAKLKNRKPKMKLMNQIPTTPPRSFSDDTSYFSDDEYDKKLASIIGKTPADSSALTSQPEFITRRDQSPQNVHLDHEIKLKFSPKKREGGDITKMMSKIIKKKMKKSIKKVYDVQELKSKLNKGML